MEPIDKLSLACTVGLVTFMLFTVIPLSAMTKIKIETFTQAYMVVTIPFVIAFIVGIITYKILDKI